MESNTVYFDNPGIENTDRVLAIAKERAEQLGIETVVVASTSGRTAIKAMEVLSNKRVIIVRHSTGFREPNSQEFTEENMKIVQSKGVPVVTAAHAFGGLTRAMRQGETQIRMTYVIGDIVASTLRIFGHGMKVACEIAVMATDAGLLRSDEEAISIAGEGHSGGANTAIVVKPETVGRFFDFRVKEILCKPRE